MNLTRVLAPRITTVGNFSCSSVISTVNSTATQYVSVGDNHPRESFRSGILNIAQAWKSDSSVTFASDLVPSPSIFFGFNLVPFEEIVIGVLSVIIVSVTSSLVYDAILRRRLDGSYADSSIEFAATLEAIERVNVTPRWIASYIQGPSKKRKARNLLYVFSIALLTLCFDVSLIAGTQQSESTTTGRSLGFELIAPTAPVVHADVFATVNTVSRPCAATPLRSSGEWRVALQVCSRNFFDQNILADPHQGRVSLSSIYHSRGAEHFGAADNGLTINSSMRVFLRAEGDMLLSSERIGEFTLPGAVMLRRTGHGDEGDVEELVRRIHIAAIGDMLSNEDRVRNVTVCPINGRQVVYGFSKNRTQHALWSVNGWVVHEDVMQYTTTFEFDALKMPNSLGVALTSMMFSAGLRLSRNARYVAVEQREPAAEYRGVLYESPRRNVSVLLLAILVAARQCYW